MKGMILYAIVFPLTIYLLARAVDRHLRGHGDQRFLIIACLLFSTSTFLPSPIIDGLDTQFWTHLVGGGIFCGFLWLYLGRWLRVDVWWRDVIYLFALTSACGVLNEIYELLAYVYLGGTSVADTSWDLLANSLGAGLFYGIYRVYLFMRA